MRVAAGALSVFIMFVILLKLFPQDHFGCIALDTAVNDSANCFDPVTQNGEDAKLSHHDADGRDDK